MYTSPRGQKRNVSSVGKVHKMSNTNKDFDLLTLSQDVVTNTKSGADLSNLLLSYREKVATRFDDYLLE